MRTVVPSGTALGSDSGAGDWANAICRLDRREASETVARVNKTANVAIEGEDCRNMSSTPKLMQGLVKGTPHDTAARSNILT